MQTADWETFLLLLISSTFSYILCVCVDRFCCCSVNIVSIISFIYRTMLLFEIISSSKKIASIYWVLATVITVEAV